jgi:CubicO group peptidase (beta-lactamase class C family)
LVEKGDWMHAEPEPEDALKRRLKAAIGRADSRFAAATVTEGRITKAVVGVEPDADFEIGSISKAITGLLYADAVERGEVEPRTTLGELLPLGDSPVARLTLSSLSVHASGLPRLAGGAKIWRRSAAFWMDGANPYGETLEDLLAQAKSVRLRKPAPHYSNFGFELLGHAVAASAGLSYADLLEHRLCTPLGLTSVYAPSNPAELKPEALTGRRRSGQPMQPWTGEALAPAGGIRASIEDMAQLAAALLKGVAPGGSALGPVANFAGPAVRIGAGWITTQVRGQRIVWHNGATGGFRSWIGLDRDTATGVVIMSASSAPVDRHGFRMLTELSNVCGI